MSPAQLLAPLLPAMAVAVAASRWASRPRPSFVSRRPSPGAGRSFRHLSSEHRRALVVGVGIVGVWALGPVLAAGLAALSIVGARTSARRARRRVLARRDAAIPDLIDLFVIAAAAGHTAHGCIHAVAPRAPEAVQPAMGRASRRLRSGDPVASVLSEAGDALGPLGAPLTGALSTGAATGAPMAISLAKVGEAARELRRGRAEERARRLPVAQLFPLVLCILPAFLLLAVVPLLVGSLGSLQP